MYVVCSSPLNCKETETFPEPKKCISCSFRSLSNIFFLRHTCDSRKWLHCEQCNLDFVNKDSLHRHLYKHIAPDSDGLFRCLFCDHKTPKKCFLSRHVLIKHLSEEERRVKWHKCKHCDYRVPRKGTLKDHIYRKHLAENVQWLKCELCEYKTKAAPNLRHHVYYKHVDPSGNVKVQCDICQIWMRKSYLEQHITNQHKEANEKDKCDICQKTFTSLAMHMSRAHSIDRRIFKTDRHKESFQCKFCPYIATDQTALRKHIHNRHTKDEDINWFQCTFCDYKAKIKASLRSHIRGRHKSTVNEPNFFECDYCGFKAKWKATLRTHILVKHMSDPSIKLIKCALCDYKHIRQSMVDAHVRGRHLEQPMQCEFCQKICKNQVALKQHIRLMKHIKKS